MFQIWEKCHWYFDRDWIESVYGLGKYGYFSNINSSNPESQCIFQSVSVVFSFFHQFLNSFLSIGLLPPWVGLFLDILFFWCDDKWDCFLTFSDNSLLLYRHATDLCALTLYPSTSLNSLISSSSLVSCHLQWQHYFHTSNLDSFYLFVLYNCCG